MPTSHANEKDLTIGQAEESSENVGHDEGKIRTGV